MVALRHVPRASRRSGVASSPAVEQVSLARLIALHLWPGAVFTLVLVLTVPAFEAWGIDAAFALFGGIGLVLAPLELGYLAWYARRSTGTWSPLAAVDYTERIPRRRMALMAGGLAGWFFICLAASIAFLDGWLSDHVFSWMPHSLLQFSSVEQDESPSTGWMIAFLVIAFAFNGVLGPITEELYFRGHLLPRLERYGRWAPVISTVLFAVYHVFSPWRYPAIILGFLPITWAAWRTRSVFVSIAAHMTINIATVLLILVSAV
jgi:membrane protease YdiL (CAAX protease family)